VLKINTLHKKLKKLKSSGKRVTDWG